MTYLRIMMPVASTEFEPLSKHITQLYPRFSDLHGWSKHICPHVTEELSVSRRPSCHIHILYGMCTFIQHIKVLSLISRCSEIFDLNFSSACSQFVLNPPVVSKKTCSRCMLLLVQHQHASTALVMYDTLLSAEL